MGDFYNYIYLDPRKPGKYTYGEYSFYFEPFYVGKGKNKRFLDHIYRDRRNAFKYNVINKIILEGYDLHKYIIKINNGLTEEEAFQKEKELIKTIGKRIEKRGPLCNMDDGGKGSDTISNHPDRLKIIEKVQSSLIKNGNSRKGKTYEEIYKERAAEEREKRSNSLKGIKHSKERREKSSKSHKGKKPWNKGLDKNDPRVLKYVKNRPAKSPVKIYVVKNIDNEDELIFDGKKELVSFFKKYNSGVKRNYKVNNQLLIERGVEKNFILIEKRSKNAKD